jgi:hypothetical protein
MAFDTSGFNLSLGQQQAIVPSLAGLAPYAPNFQGLAFKPANIQPPDISDAKGIGAALGSIGAGIQVAYKDARDEKKELRKYALESAKLAASENKDAIREARAQQNHADAMAMQAANLAVSQGQLSLAQQKQSAKESGTGNYDEYVNPETTENTAAGDRIQNVLEGIEKKETPRYFPESKLELGAPSPQVDEPGISFDGGNNLGALSAPVVMPPQEDQRYAALREMGGSVSPFSVASADGAGMQAPTPDLPYSLQGGVPKALAGVQVPSTRELYAGSEFAPTPIPTYGSTTQQPAAARGEAPQPSRSPIVAFPISDPKGGVLGYAYYDKVSRKLIPGSYVAETKTSSSPLADVQIPEGFRPKSMSVNAKGEKSYTYEPKISELSEGQARILNSLRDDYKSDAFIKAAQDAVGSQGIIEQSLSEQNGFGDIMAINAMQRMIDPGVAVREGDVRLIQDAIPRLERMGLKAKNWFVGDQLTPEVRTQMMTLASKTADKRSALANERSVPKFKQSAEKIGLDFNLVGEEFPVKSKKFQKDYIARQTELDSLIKEIDSSKDQNSADILAKKKKAEQLYLLQKK